MLEESTAMSLVYARIPSYSAEQRRRAFQLVMDEAVLHGVTSVQDNSVMDADDAANYGWENFLVLEQLKREGKLKFHITEWLPFLAPVSRLEEMRALGEVPLHKIRVTPADWPSEANHGRLARLAHRRDARAIRG